MRPTAVQLELTYYCNNRCSFCYNNLSVRASETQCLSTHQLKGIISDLASYGVFTVNFNGGEPLLSDNLLVLAQHAVEVGLDVHLNTNCTLVTKLYAKALSVFFKSICTSFHGHSADVHDVVVGRTGAFEEAVAGVRYLQDQGVYVAVNVVLSRQNIAYVDDILCFLRSLKVETVLLTRVITFAAEWAISDFELFTAIEKVMKFEQRQGPFARVAFPQPFRLCECMDEDIKKYIADRNIACAAGCLVTRITPTGDVTPCPVMSSPVFGNLHRERFTDIWDRVLLNGGWRKCYPKSLCSRSCKTISVQHNDA